MIIAVIEVGDLQKSLHPDKFQRKVCELDARKKYHEDNVENCVTELPSEQSGVLLRQGGGP